jgi:hypothetical protein
MGTENVYTKSDNSKLKYAIPADSIVRCLPQYLKINAMDKS